MGQKQGWRKSRDQLVSFPTGIESDTETQHRIPRTISGLYVPRQFIKTVHGSVDLAIFVFTRSARGPTLYLDVTFTV